MSVERRKNDKISRRQFLERTAMAGTAMVAGSVVTQGRPAARARGPLIKWDREADIVVIGAGATGLPAAIVAREAGANVIVVEANFDIGGHAITSGGNIPLGGGTSAQRKAGIEDSPDLLFQDLTGPSSSLTDSPTTGTTTGRSSGHLRTIARPPLNGS